jgi:hypothetical protein
MVASNEFSIWPTIISFQFSWIKRKNSSNIFNQTNCTWIVGPHQLLERHKQFKDSRVDDDLYFHWNGSTLSYHLKKVPKPSETSDDDRSDEVKEPVCPNSNA